MAGARHRRRPQRPPAPGPQRLDAGEILKRSAKHGSWLLLSLWTGFTFVGYFVPIRTLAVEVMALQGPWQIFWIGFYGLATYGNAGFLREQVCKHMCPYARFQSAMLDKDTLIVTYDSQRGEPRGMRSKGQSSATTAPLGDCIDCTLCVQVCPVGIDIRNGLQYECIGCGLCVDACDSVMDKVHLPRGLIRFATQNGMENRWNQAPNAAPGTAPAGARLHRHHPGLLRGPGHEFGPAHAPEGQCHPRPCASGPHCAGRPVGEPLPPAGHECAEAPQPYHISATGLEGLTVAKEDR